MVRAFLIRALVVAAGAGGVACGSADAGDVPRQVTTCGRVVLDGGGGIELPADGSVSAACQTSLCNYQTQAGCDANESCIPTVEDDAITSTCAPAGSTKRGAACTSSKPCEAGEVCAGGRCRKLCCDGDWTACDDGESCFMTFGYQLGDTPTPTGAWLCAPVGTCSVLDAHPAACQATEDCKFVDSRGSEACVPKSPGKLGEACSKAAGRLCGAGLTCVGRPDAEVCRRLCRAEECGAPACPPEEGACVHFDRDPPGVGECTPGW